MNGSMVRRFFKKENHPPIVRLTLGWRVPLNRNRGASHYLAMSFDDLERGSSARSDRDTSTRSTTLDLYTKQRANATTIRMFNDWTLT